MGCLSPCNRAKSSNPRTASLMLQAHGLAFSYPDHPVIVSLSASVASGLTLVRGGDGRGKTTLLRLLAGDLKPDAGQVTLKGIELHANRAAYLGQVFWIEPYTSAFDQMTPLAFFELQRARYPEFDSSLVETLVEGLDLALHVHKKLHMLSTGSKRKVFLTAAFASGAAVTLMDMPFAAVDKASISFMVDLLQEVKNNPHRAYILADYEAVAGIPFTGFIDLGD